MKKLLVATNNRGKMQELQALLGDLVRHGHRYDEGHAGPQARELVLKAPAEGERVLGPR